jgi:hypothetical protein
MHVRRSQGGPNTTIFPPGRWRPVVFTNVPRMQGRVEPDGTNQHARAQAPHPSHADNKHTRAWLPAMAPHRPIASQPTSCVAVPVALGGGRRMVVSSAAGVARVSVRARGACVSGPLELHEALMCTTAAPCYFPLHNGYIDGGVYANNPALW